MTTNEQYFINALLSFEQAAQTLHAAWSEINHHTGDRFIEKYPFETDMGDLAIKNIPAWREECEKQLRPTPLIATANSIYGTFEFDPFTGNVLNADINHDDWRPEDVPTKFDIQEYYNRYMRIPDDIDILDIGYWMEDGRYKSPVENWRQAWNAHAALWGFEKTKADYPDLYERLFKDVTWVTDPPIKHDSKIMKEDTPIKCPNCMSYNVKSIDNEPLAHGDQLHGMGQYDTEIYLEFECYECSTIFKETLDIVRRKTFQEAQELQNQIKQHPTI